MRPQEQVKDKFELRQLDQVAVKGKTQGVNIYELLGVRVRRTCWLLQARDQYEQALQHYYNQEFEQAIASLKLWLPQVRECGCPGVVN